MPKIVELLKNGKIGVIPTDTIYGLVGKALDKEVIKRIYRIKKRSQKKPFIVLINSIKDLDKFDIKIDARTKNFLNLVWPGRISVILAYNGKKFNYLAKKSRGLAFRLPKPLWLRGLLKRTGPLVAPSANISNQPPAKTIKEAIKYFNEKVDFYLDKGEIKKEPSILIKILR